MKNIIIVEGKTDQKFLEEFIAYLKKNFPLKYVPIDVIKKANGQDGVLSILNALKILMNTGQIKNIGILIDADEEGVLSKLQDKINPAIEKAFHIKSLITSPNKKCTINFGSYTVNIFCHIFNVSGKGELEDILKEIRSNKNTPSTLCLDKFVNCINGFNEAYDKKEYNKNFIYFYGYDCIKKEGLCSDDTRIKLKNNDYFSSEYWDFEHDILRVYP